MSNRKNDFNSEGEENMEEPPGLNLKIHITVNGKVNVDDICKL